MTLAPFRDGDRPVLSVRNMSKTFAGNTVLADVELDLMPGEIHALVGENGSGKSTLIKCIAGFHVPDEGARIFIGGEEKALPYTPADALRFGMGFVHQNLALIPTLTVAENIGLYRRFDAPVLGRIDRRALSRRAEAALAGFAAHIEPLSRVSDLAQADKTLVAIARGLATSGDRCKVLVLDEPTAALPVEEVDYLLAGLRRLAAQGVSLVYVSHRLPEVLALADRVTALRDGRRIATMPTADLNEKSLAELIVGHALNDAAPKPSTRQAHTPFLEVSSLSGSRIKDATFAVGRGEIVGIAGLLGSGRSELGRLIYGAQPRTSGKVMLEGREVGLPRPRDGMNAGIGYVPEDRLGKGGFPDMSIAQNLTLSDMREFWRGGWLRRDDEKRAATELIRTFKIRPADPSARFRTLSGGNQQKTILGRTLRLRPRLIVLDEPVQGVDIGSKLEIFSLIKGVAETGTAALLIDSDFSNLCQLCDRVLILSRGAIRGEVTGADLVPDKVVDAVFTS